MGQIGRRKVEPHNGIRNIYERLMRMSMMQRQGRDSFWNRGVKLRPRAIAKAGAADAGVTHAELLWLMLPCRRFGRHQSFARRQLQ